MNAVKSLIEGLFPVYLVPLGFAIGIGILSLINVNHSFMAQIEWKRNFRAALGQIKKYNQAKLSVIGQKHRKQKFGK